MATATDVFNPPSIDFAGTPRRPLPFMSWFHDHGTAS
jgi:hypothetical protein